MNKSELIDRIASEADISKAAAGRALEATTAAITGALKKGDSVSLIGFGTFDVGHRAPVPAATPKQVMKSKSRQPRYPSSVRARL